MFGIRLRDIGCRSGIVVRKLVGTPAGVRF